MKPSAVDLSTRCFPLTTTVEGEIERNDQVAQ
jgi:hypothetical protein